MPDTLVIDPLGDNIVVAVQRAGLEPDRRVGDIDTAAAGNRRSFITAEYRVANLLLVNCPPATARQIKAKFALGAQVPCAGTVWLNTDPTDIVVVDGVYSDSMETGGPYRVPSLLLNEVGDPPVVATAIPDVYLTNVVSPSDGTMNHATAIAAEDPFGAGTGSLRLLAGATPATCGGFPDPGVNCPITYTSLLAPEFKWRTAATVANGWLTGKPVVTVLSIGGTYDRWQAQESMCRIFVVRGGVDVAEFVTGYSATNGGFAGSNITMTGLASVIFESLIGDYFRIQAYGRLGLHGGYSDDDPAPLARQSWTFGNGGGGSHYGRLAMAGLADVLP